MEGELFECSKCGIKEKLGQDRNQHLRCHIEYVCEPRIRSNENIKQKNPSCPSYGIDVICMTCGSWMCSSYFSHCKCSEPDPTNDIICTYSGIYVPKCFFLSFEEAKLLTFKDEKERMEFVRIVEAYQTDGHKVAIYFKTSAKKELGLQVPPSEYNFSEDSLASGNRIISKLHDISQFGSKKDIYMGYFGNQWFSYRLL